ncbi:hypothetical protein V866_001017 [Kwoniella sp. B9012]|uniref:SprT-like domain-containing protein n=1 Tax=Kwoniella europaea PYCC6329 TaxID=1423913 RepID=A0AAX4KAI6_9TREE
MSAVALAAKTETQLYREVMGIPFYTKEGDDYRDLDPIDPALVTVDSELLTLIEQFKTHCDYKIYVDRSYPHATGSVQKPKYGCTWYNPKGKTIKIALQGHMVTDLGAAYLRREDLPETWSAHVFYMAVVIIHELAHALRFFTGRYLPTPVKISGGVTTQIPHPNSSLPYLHGEGGAYLERFLFGGKVNAIMMPEDDEDLAFSGQYAGLIASPANDSTESWWLSMDMIVQIVEGQSGWDRCIPLGRDMFHQPTIWGPMENKARADSSEEATLQPETEAEHGSVEYWEGRERLDLSCGGAKIIAKPGFPDSLVLPRNRKLRPGIDHYSVCADKQNWNHANGGEGGVCTHWPGPATLYWWINRKINWDDWVITN